MRSGSARSTRVDTRDPKWSGSWRGSSRRSTTASRSAPAGAHMKRSTLVIAFALLLALIATGGLLAARHPAADDLSAPASAQLDELDGKGGKYSQPVAATPEEREEHAMQALKSSLVALPLATVLG